MTQDEMNALMTERFELEAAGEVDWQARAESAEARVAELEQGWRDFSTKPAHGEEAEVLVIQSGIYYADDDTWQLADTGEWVGWR